MASIKHIKEEVLKLRETMDYVSIANQLGIAKSTVHYHCKRAGLTDTGRKKNPLSLEKKKEIFEYCKTHSNIEAKEHFKLSMSSIIKYKGGDFLEENEVVDNV